MHLHSRRLLYHHPPCPTSTTWCSTASKLLGHSWTRSRRERNDELSEHVLPHLVGIYEYKVYGSFRNSFTLPDIYQRAVHQNSDLLLL